MIAWLREQPLDLRELERKVAAALRAERLAQLNALKRLAARGKGERGAGLDRRLPRLRRAARRVRRPPRGAGARARRALPGRAAPARPRLDRARARRRCRRSRPDGPQLLVCATRVAGQGITLTRASNVAFLDLEWTPGDPRPGGGPLPPHRPARRGHRLVPARARDDRRDDDRADRAQARASSARSPTAAAGDEAVLEGVVRALRAAPAPAPARRSPERRDAAIGAGRGVGLYDRLPNGTPVTVLATS